MENVGAEVGQKMRSAIKAKLLELDCYVDDELPDYIMVMVANRRTKAQMNEDLNLFLSSKTSTFVEWLHIVLKKLKEVTVTNPEVYKKVAKRKSSEQADVKVKKEKLKKYENNIKQESDKCDNSPRKSPTNMNEEFDIPLLSEVNCSTEKDLEQIEAKIRNVKSRLGLVLDEDIDEEVLKIKLEQAKSQVLEEQIENISQREVVLDMEEINNSPNKESEINEEPEKQTRFTPEKSRRHSPIVFETEEQSRTPPRKNSVLSRLGKRISSTNELETKKKKLDSDDSNIKHSSYRRSRRDRDERNDRDRREGRRSGERRSSKIKKDTVGSKDFVTKSEKMSVHSRIGVMSKIHVPEKPVEEPEIQDELKTRAVRSIVQVKPRILPVGAPQPNKNLLLKAVAEAHKSVSQGNTRVNLRKSYEVKDGEPITRKLSHREKVKLRNLILAQVSREDSDSNGEDKYMEYVPKPIRKSSSQELPEYVPSSRKSIDDSSEKETSLVKPRLSAKARLEKRRSPSPIIFERLSAKVPNKTDFSESLPTTIQQTFQRIQDRCKYWPNCRQGDQCEFVHPSTICESFPNCKFGSKCVFLHPSCKFGTACTKRDCPYGHSTIAAKPPATQPQICKFFPKCSNVTCPFYHPKLCRFGKYCKNQPECSYSHANKSSLTWRSK